MAANTHTVGSETTNVLDYILALRESSFTVRTQIDRFKNDTSLFTPELIVLLMDNASRSLQLQDKVISGLAEGIIEIDEKIEKIFHALGVEDE